MLKGSTTTHARSIAKARFPIRWSGSLRAIAVTILLLGLPLGANAAQGTSPGKARVYLIRGFINVFSLGMDSIASKLEGLGIEATVYNHIMWPAIANEAAADYKEGRVRTIILVGHSLGASAVTSVVGRLGELGVPIKLAIGLDPVVSETASGRVGRYVNYYISDGVGKTVEKSAQFSGVLENVDADKHFRVGHFNIDKNTAVQDTIIREIRAAIDSGGSAPATPGPKKPSREPRPTKESSVTDGAGAIKGR